MSRLKSRNELPWMQHIGGHDMVIVGRRRPKWWQVPGVAPSTIVGAWDWSETTDLVSVSGNGLTLSWVDTTSPSSDRDGTVVKLRNRLAAVTLPADVSLYPMTIVSYQRKSADGVNLAGVVSLRQNSAVSTNTRFQAQVMGSMYPRIRMSPDGSTFTDFEATTGTSTNLIARGYMLSGEDSSGWRIWEGTNRIDGGRTGTIAAGSSAFRHLSIGGVWNNGLVPTNYAATDVSRVAVYAAALSEEQWQWLAARLAP